MTATCVKHEKVSNQSQAKARIKTCRTCGQAWNISRLQQIPPTGYECPHCEYKRKKGSPVRQH